MSPAAFASLILCNLVWSAHPMLGKIVLEHYTPAQGALLRYGGALAAYVVVALGVRALDHRSGRAKAPLFARPKGLRDWGWFAVAGLMPFCYAPALGMTGLRDTDATHGALIIAMEPLITVLMAVLFLRDRFKLSHALAFAVSLLGFSLLSGLTPAAWARGLNPSEIGNLILLVSLIGEGAYSVGVRKLTGRYPQLGIFGSALAIGVAGLVAVSLVLPQHPPEPPLEAPPIPVWLALLWLGPLGTALGYWVWMRVLETASVASMTLTLFIQPVCGTLLGWLFLGDHLDLTQFVGGVLILTAIGFQAGLGISAKRPKILKK